MTDEATLVDYEGLRVTLADASALTSDKFLYGNAYVRIDAAGIGRRIPPEDIQVRAPDKPGP